MHSSSRAHFIGVQALSWRCANRKSVVRAKSRGCGVVCTLQAVGLEGGGSLAKEGLLACIA
eukprot:2422491-Amphidinium_carterae.1